MATEKLLVIRDVDINNTSGSALFAGSPIYGFCDTFKMNENTLLQADTTTLANPSIYGNDSQHIGSNWSRRSSDTSFIGIDKAIITIGGTWTSGSLIDSVGSKLQNGSHILTPHKILRISRSGRPVYIRDEYLIPALVDADTGLERGFWANGILTGSAYELGSAYYGKYGIKGLLKTNDMSLSAVTTHKIMWKATLWEDKEEI